MKAVTEATKEEKQRNKAVDDLYWAAMSSVREPMEPSTVRLLIKQTFKEHIRTAYSYGWQTCPRVHFLNFQRLIQIINILYVAKSEKRI